MQLLAELDGFDALEDVKIIALQTGQTSWMMRYCDLVDLTVLLKSHCPMKQVGRQY